VRPLLRPAVAILAAAVLLLPALPAAASDYEQVVDLTFPLAEDATYYDGSYRYTNDYYQCRGGSSCPRRHRATDIMADAGTPVHAVVGGTVRQVTGMGCGWSNSGSLNNPPGWGYAAIVTGDDGREYWYIHLGEQDGPASGAYADGITCGSRVERGEHLGYVGSSGNASASAPHLHLEIRDDDVTDPYGSSRINPYFSLRDAESRGDFPGAERFDPYEFEDQVDQRLAGPERVATAAALAGHYWPDGADDVVLATGRDHADAVAGTALAADLDAPLLLATPTILPEPTVEALNSLDPNTVWLLGGPAALGDEVADEVADLGVTTERLAGPDRFGTAAAIAEEIGEVGEVALAPGHPSGGAEAWPAGVLAGALSRSGEPVPLLLTGDDALPEATAEALADANAERAVLLAEDGATDPALAAAIAEEVDEVREVDGADRYDLAAEVLATTAGGTGSLLLVTGRDFPDALAAGAAAARSGSALAVLPPTDLDDAPSMVDHLSESAYDAAMPIGGPNALASHVVVRVEELLAR